MPPVGNGRLTLIIVELPAKIFDGLHNLPDLVEQQSHLRLVQQFSFIDSYALTNLVQIQHESFFHSGPLKKFLQTYLKIDNRTTWGAWGSGPMNLNSGSLCALSAFCHCKQVKREAFPSENVL